MSTLDDVRTSCWDTSRQLWSILNDPATTPQAQRAADLEFIEVNHRLAMTQGQALTAQVAGTLKTKAAAVAAARTRVQKTLKNIQSAADITSAITNFLTAVDTFIDAAKPFFI